MKNLDPTAVIVDMDATEGIEAPRHSAASAVAFSMAAGACSNSIEELYQERMLSCAEWSRR